MSTTITVPKFWLFHYQCGCVYGVLVADQRPRRVIATEAHAWRDFYRGSKKRRALASATHCYVTESETFTASMPFGPHDVQACMKESTP